MSSSTPTKPAHLVVVPFEAWGHVRPLLYLTVQLLILHPKLHMTHLLSPTVAPRAKAELASSNFAHIRELTGPISSSADTTSVVERLQLVEVQIKAPPSENDAGAASGQDEADLVKDMAAKAAAYAEAIAGYFTVLFGGQDGGEGVTGLEDNKFKEIKPSCVIFDMFQAFVPAVVHQVTTSVEQGENTRPVPVFAFLPSGPTAIIHHYAKEEDGGFLEAMQRIVNEGVKQGKDPLEVIAPLGFGDRGVMKSLPGLPTMTDFELHPGVGACPLPSPIMLGLLKTYETAWSPHLTGFVATNVEDMELEAKEWVETKMGKSYLSLGFQYSDKVWAGDIAPPSSEDADGLKTIAFLDKMLESRGPKSVIYISFGSAFFPIIRPDIVAHLLDTLLSTSTPFVFAYATELFPIPQDLLQKVQDAPFGLAVHVAPQVQVLHHAATGFFVSHCGGNSMAEAIVAGVPIVGMPFCADQGEHNEILKKYKAGTDLKQTKCFSGEGEKPKVLYDGTELVGTEQAIKAEMVDLWAGLKGDLGKQLYEGMGELRRLCEKSCSEGGASRQAMLDFAEYF